MTATGYSGLFGLTGYRYVVVAFIARLPLAMSQLGTLLLVATTTDSYAHAGLCAGALSVANALGAPWFGALTDRRGQTGVLVVQCLAGSLGLLALVLTRWCDLPWWSTAVTAAAAGFALPQIGQLARVRWRPLIRHHGGDDRLVGTAFSYEGAADEASFVLGPALVGVSMALLGTWAPLLTAASVLVLFGIWFARHPSAALVVPAAPGAVRGPVWTAPFSVLLGAQFLIGNLFGSVQTGTTTLARGAGHADSAGLFHALLGIGSVTAGVALGRMTRRPDFPRRLVLFTAAMFVLSLPLLTVRSLGPLAFALLALGFAIAPSMITTFTLAELTTAPARVATAMTLLAGATGLGYATGAAIAGRFVDTEGAHAAFLVTVVATAAALLLSFAGRPALARAQQQARHEAR